MENKKRKETMRFHVNSEERNLIEQKVKIAGFNTFGAYARKMLIDGFTVNIDIPEIRETLSLLHYAGNNLNQLAKWAHENNSIYETEIEELRQQNRQMLSTMDSIIQAFRIQILLQHPVVQIL